ncbi:hypothetical protein ASF70_15710 [Rhizobium sp. Leaf321]|nr:hypothetical protein ASF70_15710 [Rhizobium sp. Leaf321]
MSLAVWLVLWSLNLKGCELGEEFPIFSCSFSWYGSLIVELNGIWVLQAFIALAPMHSFLVDPLGLWFLFPITYFWIATVVLLFQVVKRIAFRSARSSESG